MSKRLRYEIFRRDNHTCQYCGAKAPDVELVPDHVIPVALGGKDEPSNLVTACDPCNSGKSATPPDAARVAKVSDDAFRWAQAIKAASADMVANLHARDEARAAFDKKWIDWSGGKRDALPRPVAWRQSIDSLITAGLPLPILLDCMDIAMSARKVKADDVFRYMCGIAWKEVTKLQDAAKAAIGATIKVEEAKPSNVSNHFQDGRYDLASELMSRLDEEEQARQRKYAREYGDDPSDSIECEIDAAINAFDEARYELARMQSSLERLLGLFPDGDVECWRGRALEEIKIHMAEDFSDYDVLAHTVRMAEKDRRVNEALDYLEQLPKAEMAEWMACATALLGADADGWDVALQAADYAQKNHAVREKGKHVVLTGLCSSEGEYGAMCPGKAAYLMRLEACGACGEKCFAHPVCERHMEMLVDGHVTRRSTGEPLVVCDFKKLDHS